VIDGVLAVWDCSSLANDIWTIKLISHDKNLNTRENTTYVLIDNSLQQGWPQQTLYGAASDYSGIVTGDVDGDGKLEVVSGSYEGSVYVWRHDGTLLDGWPVYIGYPIYSSPGGDHALTPALADLDGDGDLEIVINTDNEDPYRDLKNERLFVFHHNGKPFEGDWPKLFIRRYQSQFTYLTRAPVLADIDGDGDYEILLGGEDQNVYAWHHDGTIVNGWPVKIDYYIDATTVAVGDIDGDGDVEIIAAEGEGSYANGYIYAWHHDGTTVEGWPINIHGSYFQPVLGDINGDGALEVIVVGSHKVCVFKGDGSAVDGWPKPKDDFVSFVCLGDLNNDSIPEIIAAYSHGTIYAWYGDGSDVPGWPRTFGTYYHISSPLIADVDGDGKNEIALIAKGLGYTPTASFFMFNHDGTLADGYPKEIDINLSTPAITDLDRDGDVEIIAHGKYKRDDKPAYVYAWDLPGLWNEEKIDWPMLGRDARHTACYPIAPGSISGKVSLQARANNSEIITFELRKPGQTNPLASYQALTASDGGYTLTDIQPGTYDLTAKSLNTLRAKQPNITVTSGQTLSNINFSLLGGDANDDNRVDYKDRNILKKAFGSMPGSLNWDTRADFNADSRIDYKDSNIQKKNYGLLGAP
jgi:hypothetical protein